MLIVPMICATLLPVGQSSNTPDRVALSGAWNLNRELSQARPSPGEGEDTGRGRGRDGSPPGGGIPPDPEQMTRTRALLDELMTATLRLSIFQRDERRATVTQTFALYDAKRLVISTTPDDARMGKVPANKSVYDRAEER